MYLMSHVLSFNYDQAGITKIIFHCSFSPLSLSLCIHLRTLLRSKTNFSFDPLSLFPRGSRGKPSFSGELIHLLGIMKYQTLILRNLKAFDFVKYLRVYLLKCLLCAFSWKISEEAFSRGRFLFFGRKINTDVKLKIESCFFLRE